MTDDRKMDLKVRRAARRVGFEVRKSRQAFGADNLGGYMLVEPSGNYVVAGSRFEMSAEDVLEWIAADDE